MLNRFLSLSIGLLIFSSAIASEPAKPSPFEHDSLGKCFENVDSFMRASMGSEALADPNIFRTTKGSWTWVVDQTASKNYTWYLLETRDNKFCLRVFVPAASHVEFKKTNSTTRVEAFIAPSPGFPSKLIAFRASPSSEAFRPAHCYVLKETSRRKATFRKSISCDHVFD